MLVRAREVLMGAGEVLVGSVEVLLWPGEGGAYREVLVGGVDGRGEVKK